MAPRYSEKARFSGIPQYTILNAARYCTGDILARPCSIARPSYHDQAAESARSPAAKPHGTTVSAADAHAESTFQGHHSLQTHHARLPRCFRIVHHALRRRCTAPAWHLHTYPSPSPSPSAAPLHRPPSTSNLLTSASLPATRPQTPSVQAAGTRDAASEPVARLRPTSCSRAQARLERDGERVGIVRVGAEGADRSVRGHVWVRAVDGGCR
ncbi:hypothetical protein OH77DRAFT_1427520 [Trametes cingulata]|nr:hypothetical protein OH77DRAFT_1427520 [Trametes cingulata]